MMQPGAKTAPDSVLKSISCNCEASQCKTLACGCQLAERGCTEFCKCSQTGSCQNERTESELTVEDDCDDSDNEEFQKDEILFSSIAVPVPIDVPVPIAVPVPISNSVPVHPKFPMWLCNNVNDII